MEIYISAKDISPMFRNFYITTNKDNVKECLEYFKKKTKDNLLSTFRKIIKNVMMYSESEITLLSSDDITSCSASFPQGKDGVLNDNKNSNDWCNDWCNDVILYYCCRYLLYKKPIPIIFLNSSLEK